METLFEFGQVFLALFVIPALVALSVAGVAHLATRKRPSHQRLASGTRLRERAVTHN